MVPPARNPSDPAQGSRILSPFLEVDGLEALDGKFLDLFPAAVYFCDREGVLVRWNQRAVELWGREPKLGDRRERFCGSYKLYKPDGTFLAHSDCPVVDVLRTGQPQRNIEVIMEQPSGARRYVLANIGPLRDKTGAVIGAVNIFQDLTERKRAEEALRQSEHRFQTLLERLPAAAYTCDAEGLITYYNQRAVELWGREPKLNDLVDRFCGSFRLFSLEGQGLAHDECWMALALRDKKEYSGHEIVIERPDGSRRIAVAHATPYYDEQGNLTGAVNVLVDITERKRGEEALRQVNHTLRTLVEACPIAIVVIDPDPPIVRLWNPAAERLFGWSEAEVLGKPLPIVPEEKTAECQRYRNTAARGQTLFGEETYRRKKDGALVETAISAAPLSGSEGQITSLLLLFADVTDRKRAEAALRESEQRLRFVMDSMPQKIFITRPNGEVEYFNPQWTEFTGLPFEQIKDWGWTQFIHPDDVEENVRRWKHALATGEPFQFEHRARRADGEYRWHISRALPMRDAEGRIVMWIGSNTDIHDVKQLQEAFRASEEYFRDLTQNMPIVVWTNLPDGRVDFANRRWLELTGQTLEYVRSAPEAWMAALHPDDRERAGSIYFESVRSGSEFTMEARLRRVSDGTYRWYLNRAVPLRDSAGNIVKFLGTCTDIDDQKRLEAELREADHRKDQFLATLAHELRNPLAPICNALQVFELAANDGAIIEQAREMMERQVAQMVHLIDDLLDVSRITRNKLELRKQYVELSTAIQSAVDIARPLIEASEHRLTLMLPDEPILLEADLTRLAQVFSNLLSNAAKYTDRGGEVWLKAERQAAEAIVTVRDSGIGVPADRLSQIFDLFVQVDTSLEKAQGGLGIGLTLVKRLVEMHGGTVEAHSDGPGQGSTFTVRLPLPQPAIAQRPKPAALDHELRPIRGRILVVDDNKDSAASLALMLRIRGAEVRTAHDGLEAVNCAEQFQPNAVLLDIGMPKLNGYDAARRIREQPWSKNTLLVAMTGWGQNEDKRRAHEAGFDHHLTKPVEAQRLEQLLANLHPTATQQ